MAEDDNAEKSVSYRIRLSESFKQQLSLMIEKELPKLRYQHDLLLKNADDKTYLRYKELRDQYFQFSGLATLIEHDSRSEILDGWSRLQEFMIDYVKTGLVSKKNETSQELAFEKEIVTELETTDTTVRTGFAELQKLMNDPNKIGEIARKSGELQALKQKVNDLPQHRRNVQSLEGIINNFQSLFAQCDSINEMTPLGRINYLILSPDEIIKSINEETFKGFPFEPFEVFPGTSMSAESVKAFVAVSSKTSNVSKKDMPPQLANVLEIKYIIDAYKSGKKFKSDDIKEQLPSQHPFSARMVGSYLRNNEDLFGVQWVGEKEGFYFIKQKDSNIKDEEFLSKLNIDIKDKREMDKAMLKSVIDEMRQKEEYDEFMSETVHERLTAKGYEISLKGVGINLGKCGDELGVRTTKKINNRNYYEITDVVVNEEHRTALAKAVEFFGYSEFTIEEWRLQACNKVFVHPRVIAEALKELSNTSLLEVIASKDNKKYRLKNRPKSVEEQLVEVQEEPEIDRPF